MARLQSGILLDILNWSTDRIAAAKEKTAFRLSSSNTAILLFTSVSIVIFKPIWVKIFTCGVKVVRGYTLILLLITVQIRCWPLMAKSCHYFTTIFVHFAAIDSLGMRIILGIFDNRRSDWSILVTCGERQFWCLTKNLILRFCWHCPVRACFSKTFNSGSICAQNRQSWARKLIISACCILFCQDITIQAKCVPSTDILWIY